MSVRSYCSKCGKTRAEDMSIPFYRFPKPGTTNLLKAQAWAKHCYPDKKWNSIEFLRKLHNSNQVLCGRHFSPNQMTDKNKLSKYAVPDGKEVEELLANRDNIFDENRIGEPEKSGAALTTTHNLKSEDINDDDTTHSEDDFENDTMHSEDNIEYKDSIIEIEEHDILKEQDTENIDFKINTKDFGNLKEKSINESNKEESESVISEDKMPEETLYHETFSENMKNEEIDAFAKYLAGLLKQVPRNKCNRLQTDIINLIMNEMERNENSDMNMEVNEIVEKELIKDGIEESSREIKSMPEPITAISSTVQNTETPKQKRRRYSFKEEYRDTVHEEITENFGRYVSCLLQTIPHKHIRTKLQTEIVNLIMTARENSENKILTFKGTIEYQAPSKS